MVAVHYMGERFLFFPFEEIQHYFLLLKCLFSSCQLNTGVCTVLESFKGFINILSIDSNWGIDSFMNNVPLNILIVLQNFDLQSFLRYFVLNSFSLQIFKNGPDGFLKTSRNIQYIDLSSHLFNHRQTFFHS